MPRVCCEAAGMVFTFSDDHHGQRTNAKSSVAGESTFGGMFPPRGTLTLRLKSGEQVKADGGCEGSLQGKVAYPRGRHVGSVSRSRPTREIAIRSRHRSEIWRADPLSDCALTVADSDAIVAGDGGDDMQ